MGSETGATGAAGVGQMNPAALTVEQFTRLLTAAGGRAVTETTICRTSGVTTCSEMTYAADPFEGS